MTKIYVEHSSSAYCDLFRSFSFEVVYAPQDADVLCFTGGSDVTPMLYGDRKHRETVSDYLRDQKEQALFAWAVQNNIPMVGICRGAQFLNAMSGGRMYQHVQSHTYSHDLTDVQTGEVFYVTSTHHQMMMPSDDAQLVATANQGGGREWYDNEIFRRDVSPLDNEVVWYPKTRCLCFQPHPEMCQSADEYTGMRAYFRTLLNRFIGV